MIQNKIAGPALLVALATTTVLGGCAQGGERTTPMQQQGTSEVMQEQAQQEQAQSDGTSQSVGGSFIGDDGPGYDSIDYDLPSMSSDMVYATVYDMVSNPEAYVDKVIRMRGPYYHTFYEPTGKDYFFVIIKDATACCSQGLEFVWGNGTHTYPQDYPTDETEVVVTGIFKTYDEDGMRYVHLVDASMEAA